MRKRYIQDPETGSLVLAEDYVPRHRRKRQGPLIAPDLEPFVSPITGEEVRGRAALRRHNAEHEVALHADYGEDNGRSYFAKQDRERQLRLTGQTSTARQERLDAIIPIVTKHDR